MGATEKRGAGSFDGTLLLLYYPHQCYCRVRQVGTGVIQSLVASLESRTRLSDTSARMGNYFCVLAPSMLLRTRSEGIRHDDSCSLSGQANRTGTPTEGQAG